MTRPKLPGCGFAFDGTVCHERRPHFCEPRAKHAQAFFEEGLVHTKGRWARTRFELAEFQRDEIIHPLFGTTWWDDELKEWVRRYRLAWIECARKQGKSELLAGIGLKLLCADDEEGAEIYGAACNREQAGLVYNVARRMVELSPTLSKRLEVIDSRKRIIDAKTSSVYQVISADAGGNLGQNPHGVLFDEILTQPNRELFDALRTGMGARSQPLMVCATTPGNDPGSFAADEHLFCERVAGDPKLDPSRFVFMRNTPMDADWRDEKNWYYANPALASKPPFLNINVLRDEAREAEQSLAKQNTFRQFRLAMWVRQVTRWLDLHLWDEQAGMVVEDQLEGQACYGGLDLASTADFAAWVIMFPGDDESGDHVLARFWLPQAALDRRSPMRDTLDAWRLAGWLDVTPGDVIDHSAIEAKIAADASRFDVRSVGYDRWNSSQVIRNLTDQGLPMEGLAQTTTVLCSPSQELERRLGLRRLHHGGNGVLRWMVDNVSISYDHAGAFKPDRKRSTEKIDGVVALVMAMQRLLAQDEERPVAFLAG